MSGGVSDGRQASSRCGSCTHPFRIGGHERKQPMDLQAALPRATSAKSMVWGVLLMLLGLAALAAPFATSLGFTVVLAWVLMLAGLTHVLSSWHAGTLLAVARRIGVGLLYLCVGVVIQRNPLWGVAGLTMVVGAVVFADGVVGLA